MSEQGHPDGVIEIRDLQRRRGAGRGKVMASAKSTALSHGGPAYDSGGSRPDRRESIETRGTGTNIDRRAGDLAGAPSVGAIFRRRREEYGLAVDDIEAELCIRKGYLDAIETGDYDILPGTTYALGFVRAYADHIGLDAEQMVRRFKVEALGEPAPVQARAAAAAPARKRKFPAAAAGGAIAIAVVAGLGGWTLSTMDFGEEIAVAPTAASDAASAEALPAPIIQVAAVDSGPAGPTAPDDRENAAVPPFAVPAPNGQATAGADFVETEVGGDFRLTPRPKGRPVPDGIVLAAPPTPTAQTTSSVPATPAAPPAPIPTAIARSAPLPVAVAPVQQAAAAPPAETAPPAQQAAIPPAAAEKAKEPEKKAEEKVEKKPEQKSIVPDRPTVVYGTPGRARVAFTAVDTTRIRIHSTGGEVLFDGVLLPGDVYRVPDRPGLMLMTESAGGLKFTVDGSRAPAIGPRGALRHNVFLNPMLLREGRAAPH